MTLNDASFTFNIPTTGLCSLSTPPITCLLSVIESCYCLQLESSGHASILRCLVMNKNIDICEPIL